MIKYHNKMNRFKEKVIASLRWSEKYTGTDMVYLFKGASWLTLGQILSSASALLVSIAFANLLPPDIYGTYKYVISIFGILAITTLQGINTAVTQAIVRGFEGDVRPGLKTRVVWGLLGTVASLITAGYYYFQANTTLALSFLIVALFVPFVDSFSIYSSVLHGKKNFKTFSIYNSISRVASAAAMILALFFTDNPLILLLIFFGANGLLNGLFLLITLAQNKLNELRDTETLKYGRHLSLVTVINFLAGQLDKILVFHYLGAVELAVYAFAVAPIDQIKGLFKNVNLLAFPKFAEADLNSRKFLFQKMKKLALFIIAISLIYAALAPFLYKLVFPQYLGSIHYSQILALSLFAAILLEFPRNFMEAQGAKKEFYKYNIIINLFSLIALFPLIYFWGIWGAVIARTLTRFVGLVLSTIFVKKIQ